MEEKLLKKYLEKLGASGACCKMKEEEGLILLARKGDMDAKNRLISAVMKYVSDLLLKWSREERFEITEDMVQEANLAMLDVVSRYVEGNATPSFFRMSVREKVKKALARAAKSGGYPFSVTRGPGGGKSSPSSIKTPDALRVEPYEEAPGGACETPWDYCHSTTEAAAFDGELQEALRKAFEGLTEREKFVLMHRFGLRDGYAYTLEEIGPCLHVGRDRVRQIEAKALRKLRHPIYSRGLKDFLQ